jgi:hypothetical protein
MFWTLEGAMDGGPLRAGDDAKLSSLTCPLEVQDASGEVLGHYLWNNVRELWVWYPWSAPQTACSAEATQVLFETGKEALARAVADWLMIRSSVPERVKPPTAAAAGFETHNGPFFQGPYTSWDTKVLVGKTSPHEVREGDRVLGYYVWDRDHWNWEELKQHPKWNMKHAPADTILAPIEQETLLEDNTERARKAEARVAELERHCADLLASNNQLLERARDAESRLLRVVEVACRPCAAPPVRSNV